jgi:trk system potassium uptake protein TrkA
MSQKRVLVIGLGRLGSSLVEELWDAHVEIVVVDKNEAAIDAVKQKASAAFVGDGSDPRVLEGISARETDVAIVTHGEDFEASVLTVTSLAKLKIPSIVARAMNERQAEVLRAVGATRAVLVEHEMGRRLAPEVLSPAAADLMDYAAQFRIIPWRAHGSVTGKTVSELKRAHEGINVLGYWADEAPLSLLSKKRRPTIPGPDYRIGDGHTLLLIGLHDSVEAFLARDWD